MIYTRPGKCRHGRPSHTVPLRALVLHRRAGHRKSPPTVTAETIARHDERTSVGRAKVLSGGDTGYRRAKVDKVPGCLVVQTVEHHEAELNRDLLRYIEPV